MIEMLSFFTQFCHFQLGFVKTLVGVRWYFSTYFNHNFSNDWKHMNRIFMSWPRFRLNRNVNNHLFLGHDQNCDFYLNISWKSWPKESNTQFLRKVLSFQTKSDWNQLIFRLWPKSRWEGLLWHYDYFSHPWSRRIPVQNAFKFEVKSRLVWSWMYMRKLFGAPF